MDRRAYLTAIGSGFGFFAGCNSRDVSSQSVTSTTQTVHTTTKTSSEPSTETVTEATETSTETTTEAHPNTIFVATDGRREGAGTIEDPVNSIRLALRRAQPGETVHVTSGLYREHPGTVRPGTPQKPITITGPPDAVLRPKREDHLFSIRHSHVHLIGLTINGKISADAPQEYASYQAPMAISVKPEFDTDEYLTDIVVAPAGVGNTQRSMIVVNRTNGIELGPFTVIGMGGAKYFLGGATGHAGEIVYLGTPPIGYGRRPHPWTVLDQTRNVHVHHIDNSVGHPHSELVNAKMGTRNVLVEYCTDAGGSQNTEPRPAASVRLQSYDATLRWCDLRNGHGYGVHLQAGAQGYLQEKEDPVVTADQIGLGHAIYGNRITGFQDNAIEYNRTTPGQQEVVCGNTIDGRTEGAPTASCPSDLPKGNGLGHTGGTPN